MWSKVKVMVWLERVMLHSTSSQYVLSTWSHLMCFYRSSMPLSKVVAKKLLGTFHNLRWPRGEIKRGHGCRFPIQCAKFTCYLLHNECSDWRSSKTVALQFSHICTHFIHTVTCINRCKFQGGRSVGVTMKYMKYNYEKVRMLAMTSILTFFWGEVTWHDLATWLWATWVWNFYICEKDHDRPPLKTKTQECWKWWNTPGPARVNFEQFFTISLVKFSYQSESWYDSGRVGKCRVYL